MERFDCIIIGAGPAGLSAAIYTARAGLSTLVLGCRPKFAGDYDIDNYFGFSETISGQELQERGLRQAERFGAQVACSRVLGVHHGDDGGFVVKTEAEEFACCSLVIASGVSRVRPGITNLGEYEGKGVSYCVSCDGFFFRGRKVVVVGEAIFAANQALELTQYTPHVSICLQGKASAIPPEFLRRLEEAGIPVLDRKIARLEGDSGLSRVVFADGGEAETEGLFIAMGEAGSGDFAATLGVEKNGEFIRVDNDQATNIPGVYAAGDCTGGFLQIAVAVGEGAKAGKAAIAHVRKACGGKGSEAAG